MATMANIFNRFFERERTTRMDARPALQHDARNRVPAFANDDIYFFHKRIDNSGVVRQADPKSRGTCWKLIGSAVGAAVLVVGVLLPGAYSLLAGYQVQSLKIEAQRLASEKASLELEEAELISPQRMEELAKNQEFIDPPSQKVIYLETQRGSLAMNKK